MTQRKDRIKKSIAEHAAAYKNIGKTLHENPELGYKEHLAVKAQTTLLTELGFKVVSPFSGLETAYKASWGDKGPCFMFLAEYDALPDLGHACGHNLIAMNAIAAANAVKSLLETEKIPGIVMVVGTPAEEGLGGKVVMIRERAFLRVDAAMMSHPADTTATDEGGLSVSRYDISFRGVAAHASASPELGRNALDAVNLFFMGINAWRQYLPEASRVHGVITDGGRAPNIIPDLAECRFYLRAENESDAAEMERRFKEIVKGAAMMTGTKYRITEEANPYRPTLINTPLNDAFFELAEQSGMSPERPLRGGRASTDFGNLSQVVPGAHTHFKIAPKGTAWHSREFEKYAGTEEAFDQALRAAEVMAGVAYRFYTDESFREAVKQDFERKIKSR